MDLPVSEEKLVKSTHRIHGKTVVITGLYGSSHGVGKETALLYAGKGANVLVADLDENALGAIVGAIEAAGGHANRKTTDVRRPEEVEELFKFAVSTYGHVDAVVNIAGLGGDEVILLSDEDKTLYNDPIITGIKHATTIGLQYLERNTESDLKSLILVTTPGVNNARLKVAETVKALVPEYQNKGITFATIFPWFGDFTRIPASLKARMPPPVRPPLPRIALATLFIATDHTAVDVIEYGVEAMLRSQFETEAMEIAATDSASLWAAPASNSGPNAGESGPFVLPPKWKKYAKKGKEATAGATPGASHHPVHSGTPGSLRSPRGPAYPRPSQSSRSTESSVASASPCVPKGLIPPKRAAKM